MDQGEIDRIAGQISNGNYKVDLRRIADHLIRLERDLNAAARSKRKPIR